MHIRRTRSKFLGTVLSITLLQPELLLWNGFPPCSQSRSQDSSERVVQNSLAQESPVSLSSASTIVPGEHSWYSSMTDVAFHLRAIFRMCNATTAGSAPAMTFKILAGKGLCPSALIWSPHLLLKNRCIGSCAKSRMGRSFAQYACTSRYMSVFLKI